LRASLPGRIDLFCHVVLSLPFRWARNAASRTGILQFLLTGPGEAGRDADRVGHALLPGLRRGEHELRRYREDRILRDVGSVAAPAKISWGGARPEAGLLPQASGTFLPSGAVSAFRRSATTRSMSSRTVWRSYPA